MKASARTIRIAGFVAQSIVDGPGLRLTVFTQGCPHLCPGCHNPHTHDFEGGSDCDIASLLDQLDRNPLLAGVTLTGGEPLCRVDELLDFAREVISRGKDIVCFTGYTFEELLFLMEEDKSLAELLSMISLLIDGRFDKSQRDLTLRFRGSRNQRVLNLPASLAAKTALWAEGYQ